MVLLYSPALATDGTTNTQIQGAECAFPYHSKHWKLQKNPGLINGFLFRTQDADGSSAEVEAAPATGGKDAGIGSDTLMASEEDEAVSTII